MPPIGLEQSKVKSMLIEVESASIMARTHLD